MILVRNVFQTKYGKGDQLVALFKESLDSWGEERNLRILTDVSGPFFTVVTEEQAESLSDWEASRAETFSKPEFEDWFARMESLVVSGYREIFNIE